jgi:multidrug efflux pump subunit AcrB
MADIQSSVEAIVEEAGQDPEKLAGAILKVDTAGRVIRVRDVARIVVVEDSGVVTSLDGKPCETLLVYQSAEANPVTPLRPLEIV